MPVKTMADYLPVKTADYTGTLSVTPQETMEEQGDINQVVHEFDDMDIDVVTLSANIFFTVTLRWQAITSSEAGTIRDFWFDSDKGNGRARTFYWQHPLENNIYVARFLDQLRTVHRGNRPGYPAVDQVKLRIEGVQA